MVTLSLSVYYVYWKDDNGKLKKKYIGTRFDESWKKP